MVNRPEHIPDLEPLPEAFREDYYVGMPGQHTTPDGYDYSPVPQLEADIPADAPALGQMIALRGLSRRQQHEVELNKYDELTGALREKEFTAQIEADLAANPNAKRGLIFIDLGNFKKANTFGQAVGDDVLRTVVQKFRRGSDLVARLGGDEMAIYFDAEPRDHDVRGSGDIIHDEVARVANVRNDIIAKYPKLDMGKVRFFVSAGGVEYDRSASYDTNRQIANIEADSAKEIGHEAYGAYRVAEEDAA